MEVTCLHTRHTQAGQRVSAGTIGQRRLTLEERHLLLIKKENKVVPLIHSPGF